MTRYFRHEAREWLELHPDVFFSELHRYPGGGGAGIFRMRAGASMPQHDHPTGEHGYVISGIGMFGAQQLQAGDAFWMEVDETHAVSAITELVFIAISLPRPRTDL